ncbi:hypothetical protein FQA39_LY16849 [Lamprigera yunnana]|nr:hypothetical protein FQA39_LY16849 [Lamprigera yunnana]
MERFQLWMPLIGNTWAAQQLPAYVYNDVLITDDTVTLYQNYTCLHTSTQLPGKTLDTDNHPMLELTQLVCLITGKTDGAIAGRPPAIDGIIAKGVLPISIQCIEAASIRSLGNR